MIEIERKFLVNSDAYKQQAFRKERIVQGFLNTAPERTVRIRIQGEKAYLTIKGKSNKQGTSRFEWEKVIPKTDAEALLPLCEKGVIEKVRYHVSCEDHVYEVDEFFGDNAGLVIAEIELRHEDEAFTRLDWLGREVTGDTRYYNSQLSKQPYNTWNK
ncbi:CYTH domain-containing protein [Spongiimicrobium salis]|uniref:CYTH domain-containing protein n=1 Tax=Spongiimicrobium salis TaxID=1667022 RepID=UPI00374D5278